jgi:DNA repair protein RadD
MNLRPYQQRSLDDLHQWWSTHPGADQVPICCLPTASGKSVVIAELARLLFDTYPEAHPRTVVLVPSKELAEQNAEKLRDRLPKHLSVGYYSASLGRKVPDADVIVATIGSIYRDALLLGNIMCVVIDECHLVNPDGAEAGRYRKFLNDLSKVCDFRVVGWTATPFRGNGVWLTEGDQPLFTGMACSIKIQELLDLGFLSPLVRPVDDIKTRIDTDDIKTTSGDFNLADLSDRVDQYLPAVVDEACELAAERKKWIAFCATVANAQQMVDLMRAKGIATELVTGDTPKIERQQHIKDYRAGRVRCLVTVLALAVGFDVPDVDCIIWARPTKSPVLYVQGAGRGMRIAEGKVDCLWLDFSDTTERMGPVDTIRGRTKRKSSEEGVAPTKTCGECGEVVAAGLRICPCCGHEFPAPRQEVREASNAAIMASQIASKVVTYDVNRVAYGIHSKPGKPDSLRVEYYAGYRRVAQEWVCFEHSGFAGEKARLWWSRRCSVAADSTQQALDMVELAGIKEPSQITVDERGDFPNIIKFNWTKEPVAA